MGLLTRGLWVSIGLALIALPLFPLPQWVGAPDQGPPWGPNVTSWALGLLVVIVGGVIGGRLATRIPLRPPRLPRIKPAAVVVILAGVLTSLSAWAMRDAFASNPHLIDEIAQLFQARVFASGRLAAPIPDPSEAFLIAQTFVAPGGWVSQYPPVHSALLAIGMLGGAEWMVGPVLGGVSAILLYITARGLFGPRTGLAAAFLWAVSAWVLFMSGTYMNHVTATTFSLAAWALAFGRSSLRSRWRYVGVGLMLAAAAATRPLDAAAAAAPILIWLGVRKRPLHLIWIAVGAVPLLAAWGLFNYRLFGSPLSLGYSALYGPELELGFGTDLWGRQFTPLTALSNAAVAVRRLHIYFYEWPIPALLPLGLWALLARQRSRRQLVLAVGILAAPALYFLYWHSGFYPGPRFYYGAAPFLALGLARVWVWARRRTKGLHRLGVRWDAALVTAALVTLIWGWVGLLPARWEAYRLQLPAMRRHPERELAAAGVQQALVLVPESWGSRIVTNLWARGAPPGLVERAYGLVDGCELHRLAVAARVTPLDTAAVIDSLEVWIGRWISQPAPRVPNWPDPSLRLSRRERMPAECRVEMERDLRGFALYGSLAWRNRVGLDSGIVFARDLFERDDRLYQHYRGWSVWRYAPPSGRPDTEPVLTRLQAGVPAEDPPE